jgi:hypothetical protein
MTSRVYHGAQEWHDVRYPLWYLATQLSLLGLSDKESWPTEIRQHAVSALIAEHHNFPMFFVKRDLLQAVCQSDTMSVVDWETMPFPFPQMTFMMPRRALQCAGRDIMSISVAKMPSGFYNRKGSSQPITALAPSLFITALNEDGETYLRTLTKPFEPGRSPGPYEDDTEDFGIELVEGDAEFLAKMPHIVFNLLFAMAARPEYVEMGRKLGNHKKYRGDIWTPNVIGRKYATKRPDNYEPGHHASPRMHWRRGHFRQQPYGPQRSERRIIWLEPTLVSAQVATV